MSEFTSTREGFQRYMEWSLTGPPEEAIDYATTASMPNFYHVMNGERFDFDKNVQDVAEWRGKVSEYKPKVEEFLRDGDQLAARMTGTIKVEGVLMKFESFMFGQVDKESGRMKSLIERSVWGPTDEAPTHGVN